MMSKTETICVCLNESIRSNDCDVHGITKDFYYKISENVELWNETLAKNQNGNFFQTVQYLTQDDNCKPVFITVYHKDAIIGQLGIRIIESTVTYSGKLLKKILDKTNFTKRGIWTYAPIIHSEDKTIVKAVLKLLLAACDEVCLRYNLNHIQGETSPYDQKCNKYYTELFAENKIAYQTNTTFIIDLSKTLDEIHISSDAKRGIKNAIKDNIIISELETVQQAKDFVTLNQEWADKKGLTITDKEYEIRKIQKNIKCGLEKIFLGYKGNELVSGARIGCFNNISYTNFVINSYDKSRYGGSLVTWYYIQWAKKNGYRIHDLSGGKKEMNSLQYYKGKWGGVEHDYFTVTIIGKNINYKIFLFLFQMIRKYHKLRSMVKI